MRPAVRLPALLLGAALVVWLIAGCSSGSAGDEREPGEAPPFVQSDTDAQSWSRLLGDDARGVEVSAAGDGTWTVFVSVAEFLRDEPLESEMRTAVAQAISEVPGVDRWYEEDREVWVVLGNPDPEGLLQEVGSAVDRIGPRAQAEIDRQ